MQFIKNDNCIGISNL